MGSDVERSETFLQDSNLEITITLVYTLCEKRQITEMNR